MPITYVFFCVCVCVYIKPDTSCQDMLFFSTCFLLIHLMKFLSIKKWPMEGTGVSISEKWARVFVWKCLEGHSEACGLTRQAE